MGDLVVGFGLDMTLIDSRPGNLATLAALSEETGVHMVLDSLHEFAAWFADP